MSVGRYFLQSLLQGSDSKAKKARFLQSKLDGVDENAFERVEERDAFTYLNEFFEQYGVLPSINVAQADTGIIFTAAELEEPFEFWCTALKEYRKETLIGDLVAEASRLHIEGKVDIRNKKIEEALEVLRNFGEGKKHIKKLSELVPEIMERHNAIRSNERVTGVRFGLPYLDGLTGGGQASDLWVIAGNTGSGKTFLQCRMALGAVMGRKPEHFFVGMENLPEIFERRQIGRLREGEELETWEPATALFISMEMSNLQIASRALSLGTLTSGTQLRRGEMTMFSEQFIQEFSSRWKACGVDERLILIEGNINMTVNDVLYYIRQYRPAIVFVDGAYLLKMKGGHGDKQWERISEILELLKRIAMAEQIPIICTFQFNQKAKDQQVHDIMGGQAIGQIASVIIKISDDTEDMTGKAFTVADMDAKVATLLKGRSGERGQIKLLYNMTSTQITETSVSGTSVDFEMQTRGADPMQAFVSSNRPDDADDFIIDIPEVRSTDDSNTGSPNSTSSSGERTLSSLLRP